MTHASHTPGGGWRRPLWLVGALAAVVGLSFLVARPRTDNGSVAINYSSVKGAKPPGLQIYLRRADELRVLVPGTPVRAGDTLRFIARISAPRYLVVRTRDAAGNQRRLFPPADAAGAEARLVQPGEALP